MTTFSEAPVWWIELFASGPTLSNSFLPAVKDLLDNHIDGTVSTRDLAELLWPECNVRGDAQVKARQRMYKVLMRLARTALKDYCEQSGEPNKFGGIPYRWHKRRVIYGHSHNTAALSEDTALKVAALGVLKAWDERGDSLELDAAMSALQEAIK